MVSAPNSTHAYLSLAAQVLAVSKKISTPRVPARVKISPYRQKRARPWANKSLGRHLDISTSIFFDHVLVDGSWLNFLVCSCKLENMVFRTFSLLTLVGLVFFPVVASTKQFESWYPEYQHVFHKILRENRSEEYDYYLAGHRNSTRFFRKDRWAGAGATSQLAFPAASCVLDHTSEWQKVNMAGAAVLLGLTPSILAALGPSVEEMSSLFIIARRPLLGLCLAAGAPSLYLFRAVDYQKVIENLQNRDEHARLRFFTLRRQYAVMVLEFILAAGAIANNITNSYQLGLQTSCVFAPHLWYLPLAWALFGITPHLLASWVLWSRVRSRPYNNSLDWLKIQFTPTGVRNTFAFELLPDTVRATVVSWFVSIYIACFLIFGTVTFSSLIFITVRDATAVIGRYPISLLVCRMILTYELGILREKYLKEHEQIEHELSHGSLLRQTSV